jgi:hypothetical protein
MVAKARIDVAAGVGVEHLDFGGAVSCRRRGRTPTSQAELIKGPKEFRDVRKKSRDD